MEVLYKRLCLLVLAVIEEFDESRPIFFNESRSTKDARSYTKILLATHELTRMAARVRNVNKCLITI